MSGQITLSRKFNKCTSLRGNSSDLGLIMLAVHLIHTPAVNLACKKCLVTVNRSLNCFIFLYNITTDNDAPLRTNEKPVNCQFSLVTLCKPNVFNQFILLNQLHFVNACSRLFMMNMDLEFMCLHMPCKSVYIAYRQLFTDKVWSTDTFKLFDNI